MTNLLNATLERNEELRKTLTEVTQSTRLFVDAMKEGHTISQLSILSLESIIELSESVLEIRQEVW